MREEELAATLHAHYDAAEWNDAQEEYVCGECGDTFNYRIDHLARVALIEERGRCPKRTVWYPGDENVQIACWLPLGHDGEHWDGPHGSHWSHWTHNGDD
jgi:hypothetical protein